MYILTYVSSIPTDNTMDQFATHSTERLQSGGGCMLLKAIYVGGTLAIHGQFQTIYKYLYISPTKWYSFAYSLK